MVTCPNAWLYSTSLYPYVNVNVDVFEQRFTTKNVLPIFPLKFYEKFRLSKTFMLDYSVWDIINALADERIQIALTRVNYSGVSKKIAAYESYLLDFLFPESPLLFISSDVKREILLTPVYSSSFRGIIGPRIQLSIRSLIQEVRGAFGTTSGIQKRTTFDKKITTAKLIDNKAGITCTGSINTQVEPDQMEDRPPFVVRRVDSKLISRLPSLYKKYEAKKAYCCYSPHRDGQCAACRMESSVIQSKHIIQKPFRAPVASVVGKEKNDIGSSIQQTKLNPEGLCVSCQLRKKENQQNKHVATEPREIMRTSPERVPSEREPASSPESPIPFVRSPRVNWPDSIAANSGHRKSPIFNRATFIERFGNNDVIKENFAKYKPYQMQSHLDQAQQTDHYIYPDTSLEKHAMSPQAYRTFMCNCHHPPSYQYDYCSCPYCPVYWRHRFDAPALHHSQHYWRAYHHGLANMYDDLQSFS